jgi:3'(2'), 5'-bisphosphate nucleotidase
VLRFELGGTKKFLSAEKIETNRCRDPTDPKPCIYVLISKLPEGKPTMPYHKIDDDVLKDPVFHKSLIAIAKDAGEKIMEIYNSHDFGIEIKDDDSPLTKADSAANQIIENGIAKLTPSIAIISEENISQLEKINPSDMYWLIDPLDGTKEFIKRNGGFTVNIALIHNGSPVFGVVYAPASGLIYWGGALIGAWKNDGKIREEISVCKTGSKVRIVASASHLNDETKDFIEKYANAELVQVGSSIKICMIADGRADLYPRLAPTCEWDTAAADAVLRGAGGMLFQTCGTPLQYGKKEILNPSFIGRGLI